MAPHRLFPASLEGSPTRQASPCPEWQENPKDPAISNGSTALGAARPSRPVGESQPLPALGPRSQPRRAGRARGGQLPCCTGCCPNRLGGGRQLPAQPGEGAAPAAWFPPDSTVASSWPPSRGKMTEFPVVNQVPGAGWADCPRTRVQGQSPQLTGTSARRSTNAPQECVGSTVGGPSRAWLQGGERGGGSRGAEHSAHSGK